MPLLESTIWEGFWSFVLVGVVTPFIPLFVHYYAIIGKFHLGEEPFERVFWPFVLVGVVIPFIPFFVHYYDIVGKYHLWGFLIFCFGRSKNSVYSTFGPLMNDVLFIKHRLAAQLVLMFTTFARFEETQSLLLDQVQFFPSCAVITFKKSKKFKIGETGTAVLTNQPIVVCNP